MALGAFLPPLLSFEFDDFILLSLGLMISPVAFSLSNYQSFCPLSSVQKSFSFIIILNEFDYLKVLLLKLNQSEKVKLHNLPNLIIYLKSFLVPKRFCNRSAK